MKVSRVQTYLVNVERKHLVFAKVETDDGLYGWGESYTVAGRDEAIERLINAMGRNLVGRSPFDNKHFSQIMFWDFGGQRGGTDFYAAASAIDIALWDIVGKALGQPVYNLLGGACRSRVRVYANGWANGEIPPDRAAENAVEMVARGFTALKFDPFPNPHRAYVGLAEEHSAIDRVRAVREAVGPDIEILIECHRRLAPMHALRVARAIEEFNPSWYEEPTTTEDLDALAAIRRDIRIPVVAGEALYTKFEFRQLFEKGAADIINPDVTMCGGVLPMRDLAAMAEAYQVTLAPHGYDTSVGFAASIQIGAAIPNFFIIDMYLPSQKWSDDMVVQPFRATHGFIDVPTAPGLGVDLDESALRRRPFHEVPLQALRLPKDEGPRPLDGKAAAVPAASGPD
jgi:galactonate dehydratase